MYFTLYTYFFSFTFLVFIFWPLINIPATELEPGNMRHQKKKKENYLFENTCNILRQIN